MEDKDLDMEMNLEELEAISGGRKTKWEAEQSIKRFVIAAKKSGRKLGNALHALPEEYHCFARSIWEAC